MAGAAYDAGVAIARGGNASLKQHGRRLIRPKTARAPRESSVEPRHFLCFDCGFLVPQEGSNYRRVEIAPPREGCRGCGGLVWVDLRKESVCEGLAERDRKWRAARESSQSLVARLSRWAKRVVGRGSPRAEIAHPARWRLWIPRGRPGPTHRGVVEAADPAECCVAPLTGRPCLGYEVAIHDDGYVDAHDATWLLLEQRVAPLRIDGQRLDGEKVRLELTRRPTTVRAQALHSFLHRRGLSATGLDLTICESIIEPGMVMEHRMYEDGASTLTHRVSVPSIVPGKASS